MLDFSIEYGHTYIGDLINNNPAGIKESIVYTRMFLQHLCTQGISFSTTVLIDDYSKHSSSNTIGHDKKQILSRFGQLGLAPDFIFFESFFAEYAEQIIETFSPKLLHRRENGLFLTNKGEELYTHQLPPRNRRHKSIFLKSINRIPLDSSNPREPLRIPIPYRQQTVTDTLLYMEENGERAYSCPLVAAAWYLARLGIKPFSQVISDCAPEKMISAANIANILPAAYLRVESAVRDIFYYSKNRRIREARERIRYFLY